MLEQPISLSTGQLQSDVPGRYSSATQHRWSNSPGSQPPRPRWLKPVIQLIPETTVTAPHAAIHPTPRTAAPPPQRSGRGHCARVHALTAHPRHRHAENVCRARSRVRSTAHTTINEPESTQPELDHHVQTNTPIRSTERSPGRAISGSSRRCIPEPAVDNHAPAA